jgi:hypothetical protein
MRLFLTALITALFFAGCNTTDTQKAAPGPDSTNCGVKPALSSTFLLIRDSVYLVAFKNGFDTLKTNGTLHFSIPVYENYLSILARRKDMEDFIDHHILKAEAILFKHSSIQKADSRDISLMIYSLNSDSSAIKFTKYLEYLYTPDSIPGYVLKELYSVIRKNNTVLLLTTRAFMWETAHDEITSKLNDDISF